MPFQTAMPPGDVPIAVKLWESIRPPLGLLEGGDEGASEIDVLIESAAWVWFIEAKFQSDISEGTTTRPEQDQVLRNLDVGTYYAGVRPFYFSLLVRSRERSPRGVERIEHNKTPRVKEYSIQKMSAGWWRSAIQFRISDIALEEDAPNVRHTFWQYVDSVCVKRVIIGTRILHNV